MKSHVETYDIETGTARLVLIHDGHIEAPNWTPDGRALIVNGGGRLFRLPLDAPALTQIDTGDLHRLNNDHGVSPDGTTLVVSQSAQPFTSCIYTLPITGGTPTRVTPETPSWWHGWSPDGATLAYTANRSETWGIRTIPVTGGPETCVIEGGGHYDGPDYTPDGQWIWFNSDRGGSMDLWRVRPDGTDPRQMTDDARVNWFPHPSPDGTHVLYLAYEAGTEGHPANRDVQLRLMPAEGGAPRILFDLFGGQGTINVPCWSPDARHFAFVRYSDT